MDSRRCPAPDLSAPQADRRAPRAGGRRAADRPAPRYPVVFAAQLIAQLDPGSDSAARPYGEAKPLRAGVMKDLKA